MEGEGTNTSICFDRRQAVWITAPDQCMGGITTFCVAVVLEQSTYR